ncbi:MAG: ABC transporter permease [Anaerolineaceae bacterium]|nr:ABC transporter permease [Anaerolineaceae bacterium]
MAERTLTLPGQVGKSQEDFKELTYWGAVRRKLLRDKITLAAMALGLFMIIITIGAPWIASNILGYDPNNTSLRERNDPPTWAEESWPMFQQFTRTCQSADGCNWALWSGIFSSSWAGLRECFGAGPGNCHWLGTDNAGRDVLTRGIYGGRISLRIGAYVAAVGMTLGVVAGLVSGYYAATWIDDVINAIIMTLGSIPLLFLLIILAGTFPVFRTPEGLSFLLGFFGWMGVSRLLRGQIFSIREREYIIASRATGASIWRIMFRHMLPNVSSIIIVIAIFDIASAIIAEAGLSFLGVGIGPPHASWGNMMNGSLGSFTNAPWLVITPGLFIFLTTLSIYLVGDGLRDALDPWLKNE